MLRRLIMSASLCLLAFAVMPGGAPAVEIDEELRALFAAKSSGEKIPVLMIFDQPNQVDASVLTALKSAGHVQRREVVLAALMRNADRSLANAAKILDDPRKQSEVGNVRYLYLANAIAFDASWDLVTTLGGLSDEATLFLDKTYDLTAATERGAQNAGPDKGTAAVDTVWGVKYVNADRVWNELGYTGAGIVVGHIDTGVWLSHPDLAGRLWNNPGEIAGNGIDDDGNGFIDDVNGWDFGVDDNNPNDDSPGGGHGTHTAGTVAGDGTNGTLTGSAPEAEIMALKVWQADGSGGSLGMIWAAQQYAVENGARIITMSLGIPGPLPASFMRAERFNDNNIRDAGVTFFNSAGNDHFSQTPPDELGLGARVPAPWNALAVPHSSTGGVISVGGTGYKNDTLYSSSSRGPAKWDDIDPWNDWPYNPGPGLIKPDIGAPGVGVNSTTIGGGYSGDTWNGTSMSCPLVAGVAALMLEKNPSLSPAGIDSLMELNAVDLGVAGKDVSFGSGRLDAFAVLNAVPADLHPDLAWVSVLPDPSGDNVLDSGMVSEIAFELKNASPVVNATGVTASLAVVANAYVTVADGAGSYVDLNVGDGPAANLANPFSLNISAAAPDGFEFTMLVTVSASGGYQQTFDIPWYVGLPDWRTHDQGGMYLTVTDQGIIGYMSQDQVAGQGMGFEGGGTGLYVGSFWAGTDVNYICNRDFGGAGSETYEWIVSDANPNGRVRDLGDTGSDETFRAVFSDAGHASPKPLVVEQTSMAFGLPENNQFVILEYRVTNEGPVALPTLYNGVFCDFDIGDSAANLGGTDATRNLSYMYATGGTYMGIAVLGAANSAQNLSLINNPSYVYPTSGIEDGNKIKHLRGLLGTPVANTPDDWSALSSSVMNLDANGGSGIVAYALVIGGSLLEIQNAVDAANAAYNPFAPVSPETPIKLVRLQQNSPNPFNPLTEIKYTVPRDGHVDLAVYDLSGRRIRTLVSETVPEGERAVTWNGRNDAGQLVPSGMYFYKYMTAGETTSRKMTLLK